MPKVRKTSYEERVDQNMHGDAVVSSSDAKSQKPAKTKRERPHNDVQVDRLGRPAGTYTEADELSDLFRSLAGQYGCADPGFPVQVVPVMQRFIREFNPKMINRRVAPFRIAPSVRPVQVAKKIIPLFWSRVYTPGMIPIREFEKREVQMDLIEYVVQLEASKSLTDSEPIEYHPSEYREARERARVLQRREYARKAMKGSDGPRMSEEEIQAVRDRLRAFKENN